MRCPGSQHMMAIIIDFQATYGATK